jgi:iron(III) transport system permease protein
MVLTDQQHRTDPAADPDEESTEKGGLRARLGRFDVSWSLPLLIALLIAYLTLVPVGMMIWDSFHNLAGAATLRHYTAILSSGPAWHLIWRSVEFAIGASVFGTVVGAVLAWLVERTNMPGRRWFYAAALAPLIIPGSLSTFAWVLLLSPRIGIVNTEIAGIFHTDSGPFNVYSLWGMIFVEGLHLSSLAFLLISASLRSMNASLEEAAASAGAGVFTLTRRITVPLLIPALASTFLLGFVRAVEGFEVPAMLGQPAHVYVLASQIYLSLNTFPIDMGVVGTYSSLLFVIGAVGVLIYLKLLSKGGYSTVTGKGFRPRVIDLRKYRFVALGFAVVYVLALFALPTLVMIWSSFLPFYQAPSRAAFGSLSLENYRELFHNSLAMESAKNSLILGVCAATIVVLLSAVASWISVRTKIKGRQLLDVMSFVPIAIPGLVLGVAMIDLYASFPIKIYGTIAVLIIAFTIRFLPYGMRAASASIVQIHPELEEAASVSGAKWHQTFGRVLLPLLRPGLFAAWVYVFIVSMREMSSAIILASQSNIPLAVLIYNLYTNGSYTVLSALAVCMIVGLTALVLVFQKIGGKPTA